MSLPQETMLELMAYADGELEGDALARIEALVRTNDEARGVVEAMGGLGDLVRDGMDARAAGANAGSIVNVVMRRLEASAPTLPRGIALADIRAARQRRAYGRGATVVVGVLALAAAAMVFLRRDESPRPIAKVAPATAGSDQGEIAPLPGALAQASPPGSGTTPVGTGTPGTSGVDVEQVESPSHQVSVFYLPAVSAAAANSNASSVVVWIGDDTGGH